MGDRCDDGQISFVLGRFPCILDAGFTRAAVAG